MTGPQRRAQNRRIIRTFCNSIRDQAIASVDRMPATWDGHEIRELIAAMTDRERTSLMREQRQRRRMFQIDCLQLDIPIPLSQMKPPSRKPTKTPA